MIISNFETSEELMPCPFCGGRSLEIGLLGVECNDCDVVGPCGKDGINRLSNIVAWNRRVAESDAAGARRWVGVLPTAQEPPPVRALTKKALEAENAKLRAALQAVFIDSIECPDSSGQYFFTNWSMEKVREALQNPKEKNMSEQQKPSVGRTVHFAPPQACVGPESLCLYPAIITQVNPAFEGPDAAYPETVELATFGPNSLYFQHQVPFSVGPKPGHWFWPART